MNEERGQNNLQCHHEASSLGLNVCLVVVGVYILIAAGALMMVVGFLGCCGAIKESPCMLGLVSVFFHLRWGCNNS